MMEGEGWSGAGSLTEDHPVTETVRQSLQLYISGLPVPKKVELAVKGNKEVRQILSRDPNKLVARAVFGSPRLSQPDVVEYVQSPLTNEDLLREIGQHKEWMSNPLVLRAIVSNPRTPVPVAMRHLPRLSVQELNLLTRNRNVHALVRREAKRLAVRHR
ncbi:MAG: hypothetical protein HY896_01550 [Deltaproteobacteria bacterium]|nr:hypothetical protein [Deltaproteobacteria bacterium]